MKRLRIRQVRSTIGTCKNHRLTIKGLGLGKINREVVLADTSAIRGMVTKVQHMVKVSVEDSEN
jgi:large subunit ribosomal protein L30